MRNDTSGFIFHNVRSLAKTVVLALVPALVASGSAVAAAASNDYSNAISKAIYKHFEGPRTFPAGTACELIIVQQPGGEVISARLASTCTGDRALDQKVELAALKATPLPYFGYENDFRSQLSVIVDLGQPSQVAQR